MRYLGWSLALGIAALALVCGACAGQKGASAGRTDDHTQLAAKGSPPARSEPVTAREPSATPSKREETSVPKAPSRRPTVTRTRSGEGSRAIAFPTGDVEIAPRIVAAHGGYLDLARTRDGQQLWERRFWDDGTEDVHHFKLNESGHEGLVLQFVDGVIEPRSFASSRDWPIDLRIYRNSRGETREQILDAWPMDREGKRVFSLVTHEWVPLLPVKPSAAELPKTVQWMIFITTCTELAGAPCVYFGAPSEICGRYAEATPEAEDWALWIAPKECGD